MEQFVKTWTPELIDSIVQNISVKNIVPIIGPNVFYGRDGIPIQQYIVEEVLRKELPEYFNQETIQTTSFGIKGMNKLHKLFRSKGKTLCVYLNKLFKDSEFLSKIWMDPDVLEFLRNGNFPLILTTCNFRIINEMLKYNGREYDVVSYQKEKVKGNPEHDILLKEDKHSICKPAIFHLFGTLSPTQGTCVINEEEFLVYLHCLQDTNTRPENLREYLKKENNKYLLTLGCDIPDWTFRFLLYSLKANEGKLRDENGQKDYFVGGALDKNQSEDFVDFLSDINYFPSNKVTEFLQDINPLISPARKPTIFLSLESGEYDSIGEDIKQRFASYFDIWVFNDRQRDDYWNIIEEGLQKCDLFMPVVTPSALLKIYSGEVTVEIALDREPGLITEWRLAMKNGKTRNCLICLDKVKIEDLITAIKDKRMYLWDMFFPEEGNQAHDISEINTDIIQSHIK